MKDDNKSRPVTKSDLAELKTGLNAKIDSVEKKLTGKIGSVEKRLNDKIDSVEQKLNDKIDSVEQKLTGKIDSVEKKLNDKIDSVEQKLTGKIDSVEKKLNGRINSVETTVKNIAVELAKTQADVREIKHDMATKMATKDDIGRVLSAIDAFAAEALAYRNRDTLRGRAVMDHDDKLKDHESRLQKLEAK